MTPFCIAIDWGTSSFRLWLLARDGSVLAERRSDEGMLHAANAGFAEIFESHIAALGADEALPAVICGMAGAKQGWQEAGYLETPVAPGSCADAAVQIDGSSRDIRILPGIAQRNKHYPDVMRGEETQLAGLVANGVSDALVCMPGTHSKWVRLAGGKVESFATFMTGELFAALSRHTILAGAISERDNSAELGAFERAFLKSMNAPQEISNGLFALRSSQLLGFSRQEEGGAGLSGLLIGLELAGAIDRFGRSDKVVLIGEGRLGEYYDCALAMAGISANYYDANEAVRHGLSHAACRFWAQRSGGSV